MSLPAKSPITTNNSFSIEQEKINSLNLTSLTSLPESIIINSDIILPILKERFLEGIHYTYLNSSVLISLNSFRNDYKNSDQVLSEWRQEFTDCGREGVRGTLSNHLWNISTKAYYYMRRTGQDQSILLR